MTKVNIGDYVCVALGRGSGTIIGDRGGYVGRWTVKLDAGNVMHASSRDLVVINPATPPRPTRLTTTEKLDLLLDHLGLEIADEPKIVKREQK